MTPLERESFEAFKALQSIMNAKTIGRGRIYEILDILHHMVKKLTLYDLGCPTGTHSTDCTCTLDKKGKFIPK